MTKDKRTRKAVLRKIKIKLVSVPNWNQGCILCSILPFGMRARGEHGDLFPVLQLRCALILREVNQILIACLFKGSQEQFFFPSNTLIYDISRDGSKKFNIRTCEHVKQKMQP